MPDIPTRLLVISARVPEGERCDGCEYHHTGSMNLPLSDEQGWCDDPNLHGVGMTRSLGSDYRLPACRERDEWVAIPPGADATIGRQVYEPKEEP